MLLLSCSKIKIAILARPLAFWGADFRTVRVKFLISSNDISWILDSPAHLLLVKLVELISAVVFISFALEPPWDILADLSAS